MFSADLPSSCKGKDDGKAKNPADINYRMPLITGSTLFHAAQKWGKKPGVAGVIG
jgi:hypothetical protein